MLKICDYEPQCHRAYCQSKDLKVASDVTTGDQTLSLHTWQDIMKSVKSIILRLGMLSM